MSAIIIFFMVYGMIAIGCLIGIVIYIIYNTHKYCKNYQETLIYINEILENHKENIVDAHKTFNQGMYDINKKIFSINLNIDDFKEKSISITEEKLSIKYPENRINDNDEDEIFEYIELETPPFIEKTLDSNDNTIRKDD